MFVLTRGSPWPSGIQVPRLLPLVACGWLQDQATRVPGCQEARQAASLSQQNTVAHQVQELLKRGESTGVCPHTSTACCSCALLVCTCVAEPQATPLSTHPAVQDCQPC